MSNPYIGEIRLFAGSFAPKDWHLCDGTLLPIVGNETLYSLIGTTYGGDGIRNFALPDFRGRVGVNQGQGNGLSNYAIGQNGGTPEVTLTSQTSPAHSHTLNTAGTAATTPNAGSSVAFANTTGQNVMYVKDGAPGATKVSPAAATVTPSCGNGGAAMPHTNLMPGLSVNYIICQVGIYPSFP